MADQKQPPKLGDLARYLRDQQTAWEEMRTNTRLNFNAELEWFMQSCEKSETATKYALNAWDASVASFMNIAAVGVTLDPIRKFAYILPRDNKMVYDLSYMGLIDVAISSGAIKWAQAARVHAADIFELQGYDSPPIHKRNPFAKPEDRGEVIGAYVVVKTADGDYLTNAMHIDEIYAIRDRSPSWKGTGKSPWKTDSAEMEKKTVVKNAYKYWPRSEALDRAVHYLNTDGGQGIDFTPEDEARTAAMLADDVIVNRVKNAATGGAVAAIWKEAREQFKEQPEAYAKIREAVAARNRELGVAPVPPTGQMASAIDALRTGQPIPSPAPTPAAPTKTPFAQLMDDIGRAETDEELEATGPRIDELAGDDRDTLTELNDAYNVRLAYLNKKFGRAP